MHSTLSKLFFSLLVVLFSPVIFANTNMAVIGDAGLAGGDLNRLRQSISNEGVKSLILPGDNLYFGTYQLTWTKWKTQGFHFDVVAIGNHNKSYQAEVSYFNMPGEFYSVVKNGARFIVLNSDNEATLDQQFSWLESELSVAHERLIFLVYHHPTYSVGSDDAWTQKKEFQLRMRPLLKLYDHKITALLLGHAHISALMDFGPTIGIVAGAGREALSANVVSYIENGEAIRTRYLAPAVQTWAKLEIADNAREAWVHFVRVSDNVKVCTAYLHNGYMELISGCQF
jgi:hypothetical protein